MRTADLGLARRALLPADAAAAHRDPRPVRRAAHAAAALGALGWLASALVMYHWGRGWSLDLRVYLGAGHALLSGQPVYALHFTSRHLFFSYPPFALAVLSPLSLLPTGTAEVLWWLVDALALTATLRIALDGSRLERRTKWELAVAIGGLAAVALEPVRSGIDYGQVNVVLMCMVVADVLAVRGRPRGVLVGVAAAIKLTPLYFLVYFLVARDSRALRNALCSFVVCTGASWLLWPSDSSRYFLHDLRNPGQYGGLGSYSNQAWAGILHRPPFAGMPGSTAVWLALCVATTALVAWLAARVVARSPLQAVVVVALGSLLVSPLSWSHHWCWLVLLPLTAWQLRGRRSLLALQALVLAGAALAPYLLFRHGASRQVADDALVVVVATMLVGWALAERRGPQDRGAAPSGRVRPLTAAGTTL